MKQEDVNRALERSESFTEAVLLRLIALPKPWTFVVVASALAGAWAAGKLL